MEEKKQSFNLLNVLLGVFIILLLFFFLFPTSPPPKKIALKVICGAHLKSLSIACSVYKDENQFYPTPRKWCDNIQKYLEGEDNVFVCRIDKTGPCSYAMNEAVPVDANELPGDLVLLFESAPGWNQVGGADDVVTDRHDKSGANIAFADGHVKFIKAKDIADLRWTVEAQE
ncbi:MAG: hypothetical protein ISS71_08675 [Phycisphaerae bacterium]|nr:hypothetical protein [Phycisphaerae bacterium]